MNFINLTPHAIKLNDGTIFPPSGKVARVKSSHSEFDSNRIAEVTFGEIVDLPEPVPGTTYIVSGLIPTALKARGITRNDIVSPATGHPDAKRENGQIVSVPGFIHG